jgi:SIR2-like domain
MIDLFDISSLVAAYDRGTLVPFIGSGLSRPNCAGWLGFVQALEREAGLPPGGHANQGPDALTQRALCAMQWLRRTGKNVSEAVCRAVYVNPDAALPEPSMLLASLYWPLVCTTNYDEVYLRSVVGAGRALPRVLGRSERDVRNVMSHIAFPADEVLWALQGFLRPRSKDFEKEPIALTDYAQLESELVVGHAEYRKTTHRSPHLRRAFAELFRTRSLLFLGSGLEEPYFRALFDEIVELAGPPVQPHYAIVEEGKFDTAFVHEQFHILCKTYPAGHHDAVVTLLRELRDSVGRTRPSATSWHYDLTSQATPQRSTGSGFEVRIGSRPLTAAPTEALVVSCGRDRARLNAPSSRGDVLYGSAKKLAFPQSPSSEWLDDWVVRLHSGPNHYGVVARDLVVSATSSRNRRSPEAVRLAFTSFLNFAATDKVQVAHVQLLAAGNFRVFSPWVSLVQMARAYGEWFSTLEEQARAAAPKIIVYADNPLLVGMLTAGHINLTEFLACNRLRLRVEVVDASGGAEEHHVLAGPETKVGQVLDPRFHNVDALVHCHPAPTHKAIPTPIRLAVTMSCRDLGLVSGSTLTVDFQARIAQVAKARTDQFEQDDATVEPE